MSVSLVGGGTGDTTAHRDTRLGEGETVLVGVSTQRLFP